MKVKVCGQENELNNSELEYFNKELGSRFTYKGQVGRSGSKTSAYLLIDKEGNEFVLKIPNDQSNKKWILSQKIALERCQTILNGYNGDIYIPKAEVIGENYIVEPFAGNELSTDLYESLPYDIKNKIVNDLSQFIFYLHKNNPIGDVSPLFMLKKPTLEEVFEYNKNGFDHQQRTYISELISRFSNRDITDEISVMTHGDIRSQNVLYNPKNKRLAVIDFELTLARNIYHDFVPFAAASFKISYDLLFAVAAKYNELSTQYNISVDLEKIKLFHELGVFHEFGRCAMSKGYTDCKLKTSCQNIFRMINLLPNQTEITKGSFVNVK